MTKEGNVVFCQTETGFIAATNAPPYLCFEGRTEKELKEKVGRALAFYHKQEPLGAEFEKVFDDNLAELYEE